MFVGIIIVGNVAAHVRSTTKGYIFSLFVSPQGGGVTPVSGPRSLSGEEQGEGEAEREGGPQSLVPDPFQAVGREEVGYLGRYWGPPSPLPRPAPAPPCPLPLAMTGYSAGSTPLAVFHRRTFLLLVSMEFSPK